MGENPNFTAVTFGKFHQLPITYQGLGNKIVTILAWDLRPVPNIWYLHNGNTIRSCSFGFLCLGLLVQTIMLGIVIHSDIDS